MARKTAAFQRKINGMGVVQGELLRSWSLWQNKGGSVVCTPDYEDVHKVSSGLSDLLVEVFGPERGLGGRATIGVMALAGGVCFETWATIELV